MLTKVGSSFVKLVQALSEPSDIVGTGARNELRALSGNMRGFANGVAFEIVGGDGETGEGNV